MRLRYRHHRFTADAGTLVMGGLVALALAVLAWFVPPVCGELPILAEDRAVAEICE